MALPEPPTADIAAVHTHIVQVLQRAGDAAVAEGQVRYMKGAAQFYGIKTPALRALFKANAGLWKPWPVAAKVALSWALLRSDYFEEKDWGIALLRTVRTSLDQPWLEQIEREFPTLVASWATCDALCSGVFRALLPRTELRRRIISWKDSPSPWLQRAAALAFINEARHGLYNADILEVCETTVRNPHRFVQLGTGWVLRELSLADRAAVTDFLVLHHSLISAEGLRYALEKYPEPERRDVLTRCGR